MTIIAWLLLFVLIALLEGLALRGKGVPLTDALRAIRFDPIGRFVLIPFFCWMMWHIVLRPEKLEAFTWRDGVAILFGVAWALFETVKRRAI